MGVDTASIAANLDTVRERVARAAQRAGRKPEEITLVAVSKTFPAESIRLAYAAGVRHFGENRVQEWEKKQPLLADLEATWHLVGHLQSNKAARGTRLFHSIDALDSAHLAQKLDDALVPPAKRLVLIEVRLAPEETKNGASEADLPALVEAVLRLPHLDLRGLMCIPPYFDEPEQARPYFRRLRELRDALRRSLRAEGAGHPGASALPGAEESLLPDLSMGMSHDFEVAVEEGATQVRLGTAIFGPRLAVR
jgi:PLP dependent protein